MTKEFSDFIVFRFLMGQLIR